MGWDEDDDLETVLCNDYWFADCGADHADSQEVGASEHSRAERLDHCPALRRCYGQILV